MVRPSISQTDSHTADVPSQVVDPVAESLVRGIADAAVLLGPDLVPICYNRTFIEATGLRARRVTAELARNRSVFDMLGSVEQTDAKHALDALATGDPIHLGEMNVRNAAGDRFVMMQSFLPVANDYGAMIAVIAVFRDQSDEARVHLRYKELLRLEQARAEELESRVAERTQQLSEALEEVTRLSTRDPLTKLFNRRAFDEKARYVWANAKSEKKQFSLLLCDLDHFKRVNDEYGHQAGDKILVATAEALQASVRPDDIVARFGGEEFIVLVKNSTQDVVLDIAERCKQAVRALPVPELVPGAKRRQTISIGVATFSAEGQTLDQLVANADQALYASKRGGRDRVSLFDRDTVVEQVADDARPRLLLVDPDEVRARQTRRRVEEHYAVVTSPTGVDALRCCGRQPFDVILSEEDVGTESGISFLRKSTAFAPFSARVLILGSPDAFLAIRATNVGRVDQLLLREDGESHLVEALEHARLKLDLVGQRRLGTEREDTLIETPKLEALQEIMRAGKLRFAYQPIVSAEVAKSLVSRRWLGPTPADFAPPIRTRWPCSKWLNAWGAVGTGSNRSTEYCRRGR